jgi:type II secretory pathway predicted ATPase ExeA
VWKSHWKLDRDPFAESAGPYVSLPSHDEAVARLVHAIESGERRAFLTAHAGLGKSMVLGRAFDEARNPGRRFARLTCAPDVTLLVAMLAERLGERVAREPSRLAAWRALERAVRLASIQGIHLVIGIDNCETAGAELHRDIKSIVNLAAAASAKLTVIQSGQPTRLRRVDFDVTWTPAIKLKSLTRSQADTFLKAKLRNAGRDEPVFASRAVTRLHGLSAGVPRLLEQLATLCLMAAAARGLDLIAPDVVDSVEQCHNDEAVSWLSDDGRTTGRHRAG